MKGSVLLTLLVIELSCSYSYTLYDQLCRGIHNGFLRHPVECHKFIRCSHQKAYEFHCPANLLWHQEIKSCDYSYRTQCKVNAIGVKDQEVNITEILVGQHNKVTTSDKKCGRAECKNFKEIEVEADSVTATTQKSTRKLHNKVQVLADKIAQVVENVNTADHKEHSVKLTHADNKNITAKEYFVKHVTTTNSLQSAYRENLVATTEQATKTLNFLKVLPNKDVGKAIENVNNSRIKRNNCNSVSKLTEKATANKNNKRNIKKITVSNVNLTDNSTVKANINVNDSIESFATNSVYGLNLTEEYAVKITDNTNNENITVKLKNDFNLTANSAENYNAAMITEDTVHYNNVNITEAILTEPDSGITKNLNNYLNLNENKQYETVGGKTSSSENNNGIMPTDKTVAVNADNITEAILTEFPKSDTGFTKNLNNSLNLKENKLNETVALTTSSPENNNRTMLTEKTLSASIVNVTEPILIDFRNASTEIIDFPKAAAEITNNFENSLNLQELTLENQSETEASSSDNNNKTLLIEDLIYVNVTEAILTDFPKEAAEITKNLHNSLNTKENKTVAVTASSMITTETVSGNANMVTGAILNDFSKSANKVTKNLDNSLNLNENISAEIIYKDNKALAQKQSSNVGNSIQNSSMLEEQTDYADLINSTESLLIVLQEVAAEIFENSSNSLQPTEAKTETVTVTDVENRQTTAAIFNSLNSTEGFTGNHNSTMLKQEHSSVNFINSSETILEVFQQALGTTTESSGSTNTENENVAVAVTKTVAVNSQSSTKNSSATVTEKKTNVVNSIILTDLLLPEALPAKNENVTKIMDNFLNTKSYNENIRETGLQKDNNSINDVDLTNSLLKALTETAKATIESSVNITDIEKAITQDPVKSFILTESSTETNNRSIAVSTVNTLNLTNNNTVIVTDKKSESETLAAQDPVNSFNSTESSTETSNKNNFTNFTLQEADKNYAVNLTEAMLAGVPEGLILTHKDPMKTKQNSDKNKDENNIPLTVTMLTETEDDNETLTVVAENSIESNYLNKIALKESIQAENINLTVNAENPVNSLNLTESFNQTNNSDSLTDLNLTDNFPVKKMKEENVNLTVNAENPVNSLNLTESFNQPNKTSDNVLTENPLSSIHLTENVVEYITETTAKDFSVKLIYNENKTTTETTDYSINDKNYKESMLTGASVKPANDENKNVRVIYDETTPVINGHTNKTEIATATMLTANDGILTEITPTNETFIQNTENSVNIGNVTEITSTQVAVNNEHVKKTMFTEDPVKNVDDEIHNFNDFYIDTTSILKKNSATTESLRENTDNSVKEIIFTENPVKTANDENPNFKDFSVEAIPLLKEYAATTNTHLIVETSTETLLKNVNQTMEINNTLKSKNLTNLSPAITTTETLLNKNVQSESTTPAQLTTLAVPFSIDNTTVDPRLPFRSLECQGPNNRRQFKAPKCYQYYQCFAGWAFLLNCHEGWRFVVTEGQCILDVNKECEM